MRNALLPQVTSLAIALGTVASGSVLVEVVFNYPGIGWLLYNALAQFGLLHGSRRHLLPDFDGGGVGSDCGYDLSTVWIRGLSDKAILKRVIYDRNHYLRRGKAAGSYILRTPKLLLGLVMLTARCFC